MFVVFASRWTCYLEGLPLIDDRIDWATCKVGVIKPLSPALGAIFLERFGPGRLF